VALTKPIYTGHNFQGEDVYVKILTAVKLITYSKEKEGYASINQSDYTLLLINILFTSEFSRITMRYASAY